MASHREGFHVDTVTRLLRSTLLNERLTLPLAAAATYLTLPTSRPHLDALTRALSSLHLPPSLLTSALARKTTLVTLSATGLLITLNSFLNRQLTNNWTAPSDWDWTREIVLITGGSSGIGASIAQHLLARNPATTIIIIDFAPLGWTPPAGANLHYYQADLSSSAAIRDVCTRIRADVGHPTVLVNNAGIARGYNLLEGRYEDVELTIKTNLIAPMLLAKEFVPEMARRNHGHVVSLCSMSAVVAPPGIVDYAASKAGVQSFHEGLQVELATRYNAPKVRMTIVSPNFVKTPLLFEGDTGMPGFLAPLLHVDTVGERIVEALYSGYGRTIYLPGLMRFVSSFRGAPEWMLRAFFRNPTSRHKWDYTGKQSISKTGGLAVAESS
ncbi:hypothetical protein QBC39DRAFT_363908 [Podospora conica]|nr:hypothetical protein QBC39DRAFT_363908 [Schizothecium conicum]